MIVSFDPIEFYDNNWNPLPIDQMSIEARRSLASFEVRELCRCHRRNRTRIGPSHRIYDKLVASTVLAKILANLSLIHESFATESSAPQSIAHVPAPGCLPIANTLSGLASTT